MTILCRKIGEKRYFEIKKHFLKKISLTEYWFLINGFLIKVVSCESVDSILSTYAHYQNILAQEKKSKKNRYDHYQYTLPLDLTK